MDHLDQERPASDQKQISRGVALLERRLNA
jgi:hypothetical protein